MPRGVAWESFYTETNICRLGLPDACGTHRLWHGTAPSLCPSVTHLHTLSSVLSIGHLWVPNGAVSRGLIRVGKLPGWVVSLRPKWVWVLTFFMKQVMPVISSSSWGQQWWQPNGCILLNGLPTNCWQRFYFPPWHWIRKVKAGEQRGQSPDFDQSLCVPSWICVCLCMYICCICVCFVCVSECLLGIWLCVCM